MYSSRWRALVMSAFLFQAVLWTCHGWSNSVRFAVLRPQATTPLLTVVFSQDPLEDKTYGGEQQQQQQQQQQKRQQEIEAEAIPPTSSYNLGVGKNKPMAEGIDDTATLSSSSSSSTNETTNNIHWYAPIPVIRKPSDDPKKAAAAATAAALATAGRKLKRTRKMVARSEEVSHLRGAIWHEEHFGADQQEPPPPPAFSSSSRILPVQVSSSSSSDGDFGGQRPPQPALFYPNIDLSIPESVYSPGLGGTDLVWDLMRWEAFQEAQREPLLVSFFFSTILNHRSLESSLAFFLANRLSSPAMISTQIQSLILEAFANDPSIGRCLRADIMAVRDRDPACTCLPDVFLYFKGFHALQTYRVAHAMWKAEKTVLAHYLQSQMSQIFQIDIHPNATLGSGIMLDHGTGIVIGETARVGHNCSVSFLDGLGWLAGCCPCT
jgi:serine O-acetyltransferase